MAYLTHYAELYGANRSLLDLVVRAREAHGIEPFVILSEEGPLCEALQAQGIDRAIVPFVPWMHKQMLMGGPHHRIMQRFGYWRQGRERDAWNATRMKELVRVCSAKAVDLVHINSSVIGMGVPLAKALGVPLVWHIRELPFAHYDFKVDGGLSRYRSELRQADALIAISDAVRRDVEAIMAQSTRIHVVHNGVVNTLRMEQLGATMHERWSDPSPFTFLQLGLFHPSKGQLDSVEAFAQVHREEPDTRLVLAGGGRQDEVRARVKELGLSDVIDLPGFVQDPFIPLADAHCLLQCSKDEAMGRATVEAMASGIPVIGHASGATPELIEEGRSGHLYIRIDELVQRMLERVRDIGSTKSMGCAAHARVQDDFTVEAMTGSVVEVYDRLAVRS
ncbi:MAG: glycosyltransferase family 4 protein [Flavobacteriales bacterium]|nr:glycosyltransferase family 4 protein [Flavobacteriales bacterium]